ncbi:MAG: cytidine deaminase [Candidatus Nanopelagicales bacterium]
MSDEDSLSDEDAKLLVLARGARARIGAAEGAAVRDGTGRTYSGATVALRTLGISALALAVAQAAAGGATALEAAVVVTASDDVGAADLAAVRGLAGAGVPVHLAGPDAVVRLTRSS